MKKNLNRSKDRKEGQKLDTILDRTRTAKKSATNKFY